MPERGVGRKASLTLDLSSPNSDAAWSRVLRNEAESLQTKAEMLPPEKTHQEGRATVGTSGPQAGP